MIRIHKLIASCFGIGYIKGGGTIAAAITCLAWWFWQKGNEFNNITFVAASIVIVLGVWSSSMVEAHWGKDSSKVVIDEVAGMSISLLLVPVTPAHVITALGLFRFFDIIKPLYIRRAEKMPGGWGVMMDDILAGVYSNIVLQVLIYASIL